MKDRTEKHCALLLARYGISKVPVERLACSYVNSRFDTDYLSLIYHLWLIETYIAGYEFAKSESDFISKALTQKIGT